MSNVKRISKNTLFLFLRMGLLMIIGLYTTRVILEALGAEDLGISNVVGSMVLMFDFASTSLTNSTQRYLNLGLGRKNLTETSHYFSQSFTIHLLLALCIFILLETVGLWIVEHKLLIPADRVSAAMWCYQLSIAGVVVKIIKICFDSDIIAREDMSVFAYFGVFEGIAKLVICYLVIANTFFDKLIFYSWLLFTVYLIVTLTTIIYCLVKYPESRYKYYWNRQLFREILGFIGANSFGAISWAIGIQGVNIVLNMFFGPVVNAAKGIASTIQRVVTQFTSNIDLAVKPQLTKSFAVNDFDGMVTTAEKASRYIFILILFLAVPIFFEVDTILAVWLKEVPPYTDVFVQVMMIDSLVHSLTGQYSNMAIAMCKIKNQQVYGRLFTLMGLPLSWTLLHFWKNPYLPVMVMVVMAVMYMSFCVWDVNRSLHFGLRRALKRVHLPVLTTASVCFALGYMMSQVPMTDNKWIDLILRTLLILISMCPAVWFIGVDKNDRSKIISYIRKKI